MNQSLTLLLQTESSLSPVATLLFAVGCGLLTAILLRRSYRYFGKRRRSTDSAPIAAQRRPDGPWAGSFSDAQARFDRQQVELHELARDLRGQLDSKLILLQELVAKSQQQIDRLEELLDEADKLEPQTHGHDH